MCGIVAYSGSRQAQKILIDGLKRLEYRGYDSSGICIQNGKGLKVVRAKGKLAVLEGSVSEPIDGSVGIGHTRWATHGAPSVENAHPHSSMDGTIAVVHNGIIENYALIKDKLQKEGVVFKSETDTEVIAHLISKFYKPEGPGSLAKAVREALTNLEGAFGIVAVSSHEPKVLVGAAVSPRSV